MIPSHLPIAHTPTPLVECERLSQLLGVRLRVKRDDLTGSHLSGNKIRKLEFLLADAQRQNATDVLTCGGIQSNHCRATALAAAPLGLQPHLLLRTPHGHPDDLPKPPTGNVLLDQLAGAQIRTCTPAAYSHQRMRLLEAWADELRQAGRRPYVVPEGGSNALGSLGYVRAVEEIAQQLGGQAPSSVVVPTGSGGTLAGVAIGLKAAGLPSKAWGVAVCDTAATFRAIVHQISEEATRLYDLPRLTDADFDVLEGFQGRGYALSTPEELCFLKETAQKDGLVLDPVYTGKAFLGLVRTCQAPERPLGDDVLFIHTGGLFGLLAQGAVCAEAWK